MASNNPAGERAGNSHASPAKYPARLEQEEGSKTSIWAVGHVLVAPHAEQAPEELDLIKEGLELAGYRVVENKLFWRVEWDAGDAHDFQLDVGRDSRHPLRPGVGCRRH